VTIGNFDGCHRGHQALIAASLRMAEQPLTESIALSFAPRPSVLFRPETSSPTLFTDSQKVRALAELGIQHVILQRFDREFSILSPEDFYKTVLRDRFKARFLAVGQDFCFGRGRAGDASWLKDRASQDEIQVDIGDDVFEGSDRISSTQIRESLSQKGDVQLAAKLLGRPYMLEGVIEKGDQIGRTWGFPTANLGQLGQLVPLDGVYAGWVWLSDSQIASSTVPQVIHVPQARIPAVFSIGTRPSLKLPEPILRVEAHLLKGNYGVDSLYGVRAGYYLTHRIRANRQFDNFDALRNQIQEDAHQARMLLV